MADGTFCRPSFGRIPFLRARPLALASCKSLRSEVAEILEEHADEAAGALGAVTIGLILGGKISALSYAV